MLHVTRKGVLAILISELSLVLALCLLGNFFMLFCRLLFFFSKSTFSKNSLGILSVCQQSNSFNPDQVQHFVEPGLGSNCMQRLSSVGKELNRSTVLPAKSDSDIMFC